MNSHILRFLQKVILLKFFLISLCYSVNAQEESAASVDGQAIFKANCATCHSAEEGKVITGPSLKGVRERWSGQEALLYEWIKNPKKTYESKKYSYLTKLVDEYSAKGTALMSSQAVSNEEIDAIFDYVESYVPKKKEVVADEAGEGVGAEEEGSSVKTSLIILAILLIVAFSAAGVKRPLQNLLREKQGLSPLPDEPFWTSFGKMAWEHKKLTSLIVMVLLFLGLRDSWYTLKGIGVNTGYTPEQPIKFSHKIHAGENKINCVYCHSGAEKSKHSGIPSANVCMNCHKYVKEGKRTGTKEIAKIYEALDYDPETQKYGDNKKPIQWVKVHNLPDHVYFNHSQHVKVAGLECQTCHGPIDTEMDAAQQYSSLTMGWCIDCHNKTEIQPSGYYEDLHSRLSVKELKKFLEDDKITAREMGGWECSKCHY